MNTDAPTLTETVVKTMVSHTITYFLVGALAFFTLDYARTVYSDPSVAASSRSPSDPMVMAGPLFQPIRGLLFGFVFSRVPVPYQLLLLPEVFVQSFLLSALLFYWINYPKKWLNWVLGVLFLLILIFPALGLMVAAQ